MDLPCIQLRGARLTGESKVLLHFVPPDFLKFTDRVPRMGTSNCFEALANVWSMLPALCQHAQVPAEQRKAAETEAKRVLEAEQEASHMISFFSV